MGFYLKKSIKVGALRFNLSKSGIGVSAGIKGLRIGSGPKGNYIHAGANGFYYRKTIGNTNKIRNSNINPEQTSNQITEYNFQDIESGNIEFMTDNCFEEILSELNSKSGKISFLPLGIVIPICLMFINPIFIFCSAITIPLSHYANIKRKTTYLIYDIEENKERELQQFYDCFNSIMNASRKWHISSSAGLNSDYDKKINAGATNLVRRTNINIRYDIPKFVTSNIKIPTIPVGRQILYFFPERILIKDGKRFGTINYNDLEIDYRNTSFIETEGIPSDSEVIGKTWKYVNKKGGPDKRFKDNIEIPILKYSEIYFKSKSGLNEMIQVSKADLGENIYTALKERKI